MADFADFKIKYPELASIDDGNQSTIEACLSEAGLVLNLLACPKFADLMQLTYAAHCVAKSSDNPLGRDTRQGPATSISVGSLSASYEIGSSSTSSTSKEYYMSTTYGQDFLRWRRMCFGSSVMTT